MAESDSSPIEDGYDVDLPEPAVPHKRRSTPPPQSPSRGDVRKSYSPGTQNNNKSSAYSPSSPDRSPVRRPATPLKGIGKFLQHRRSDSSGIASPDSPSVRSDLLSGSVVAGLVAAAIQEVEATTPNPQTNKVLADLIERAVKAEFRVNQLEQHKSQIWNLVSIAEEEAEEERRRQLHVVSVMLLMVALDAILLVYVSLNSMSQLQQWIGSILSLHVTMMASALYILKRLFFGGRNHDDHLDDEEEELDVEDQLSQLDESTTEQDAASPQASNSKTAESPIYSSPTTEATTTPINHTIRENEALLEFKETAALLPKDQKGVQWIKDVGDEAYLAFLRGYLKNVTRALKYLVKTAEWREDYGANTLITTWEQRTSKSAMLLKRTWPASLLGQTLLPDEYVYLFRAAMCDFPGYFRSCAVEDVTKHVLYLFEKHRELAKWKPAILIVDLGVSPADENKPVNSIGQMRPWIAAVLQFIGTMTKICDPHYPEMFSRIYFVRVPLTFWAIWRVAQILIPNRTRAKISILGVKEIETKLKQDLPANCVPDFLGGQADTSKSPKGGLIIPTAAMRALETQ